jgi:hypothetical protein
MFTIQQQPVESAARQGFGGIGVCQTDPQADL